MLAQGRAREDKALSIALRFPSVLFLNHPPALMLLSLRQAHSHSNISNLRLAPNKRPPACCSLARTTLPSSISANSKGLHYRMRGNRVGESLSLLMVAPIVFFPFHWKKKKRALSSVITFSAPTVPSCRGFFFFLLEGLTKTTWC